jgi:MoxR-like ATPase
MKSFELFRTRAQEVLFDRNDALETALAGLLAKGHLLIEDLPGVGKTSFALTLAKLLGLDFRRLQMTNDLLPADVLGSNVFMTANSTFEFRAGPIFSQVLLADELNRASPRTQSAFMEAMEERSVSIDGVTRRLPEPFFVLATQNPEDQAGTSALPEGQLDRFMMSLHLGPPTEAAELRLLQGQDPREQIAGMKPVMTIEALMDAQKAVNAVHLSKHLATYIRALLERARSSGIPLSPRSGQHAARAARAFAWLAGRDHVLPEDVKRAAPAVWAHRCGHNTKAGHLLVREWLEQVRIPV